MRPLLLLILVACAGAPRPEPAEPEGPDPEAVSSATPLPLEPEPVPAPAPVRAIPTPTESQPREMCRPGTPYRGRSISIDLKDAEIHNTLRFLAEVANLNIVVADDVKGSVTLRIHNVPWDQILCTIVRTKRLVVSNDRGVLFVVPESASH